MATEAEKKWEEFDQECFELEMDDDHTPEEKRMFIDGMENGREAFQQSLRAMVEAEIERLNALLLDIGEHDEPSRHDVLVKSFQCRQFLVWIDECKPEKV